MENWIRGKMLGGRIYDDDTTTIINQDDHNKTNDDEQLKKYLKMETSVGLIKAEGFDDDGKSSPTPSFLATYLLSMTSLYGDSDDSDDGEEREFGNPKIKIPLTFYIDSVNVFSSTIHINATNDPDYEIDIEDRYIIGKTVEEINEYVSNIATIRDTAYNISALVAIEVIEKFKSILYLANKSRYMTSEMEEFVKNILEKIKIKPRRGDVDRGEEKIEEKEPEIEITDGTGIVVGAIVGAAVKEEDLSESSKKFIRIIKYGIEDLDDTDNKYIASDDDTKEYKKGDDDGKEK